MYGKSVMSIFRVVSSCNVRFYNSNSTKKLLEFLADMPKANSTRIAEAQRQRQNISKKSEKYGPSTVYLQVIGSGARGAPNTLYLFTDQKRYLFNCGECTQRLAHEHKVKLSRLDHIFITSKTWRNIGGLPGLSLTLQDVGVPNITLHGPEGLDELYNATRRFVIMKDMNVTMAKCSPTEDFEDNVMTVKYVLLGPHDEILNRDIKPVAKKPKLDPSPDKEFEEFTHDETDYYTRNTDKNFRNTKERLKSKVNQERDVQKKKTEKVLNDLQKKSHCTVAYICTLKKRLGTLDLAKCVEMGVKPGPLLGQLKNGHDVVLPDGTFVLSKDVKTPDDPGPVFIVLDVPDVSYLKESEFSAHFDDGNNPPENIPSLIVHYTPPEVFHHPTYRSFMSLFGPTTRHLILNAQNSCLGSEAVHRTQHKLHLLDADIFPLLKDASVPAVWNSHPPVPKTNSPIRLKGLEELKNKIALAQFQNIINMEGSCKGDGEGSGLLGVEDEQGKLELIAGRTLTMFHLRPKKQLDRSAEPKLHVQDYIQETMDVDGFVGSLDHFRRQVDNMRYMKPDNKEFPKVVFLGTGSCIPSKTRNTSAIVLQIDENRSMLLDCGEGTFGQLVRFYGSKRVSSFLRTLRAVYVSHLHADHHIGLIGVIQARRQAYAEINAEMPPQPLYLLAPGQIFTWLSVYDQQFEHIREHFTLIPNQTLLENVDTQNPDMTSAILANIGVQQIRTCLVSHCPNAFGVAIQVDPQHKITYSGDTIPCEELVKIGDKSTLLIHEATMEDELAEEARTKMHSTTSQAIDMGRQMGARYTVLTHFSQRYARLPRLNAHILHDNHSVGIAFDNMQITMNDLELLPHMYAPLQLMFAEHCVEMELKAAHRALKKERRASQSPPGNRRALPDSRESPTWRHANDEHLSRHRSPSRTRQVSPGCAAFPPVSIANYRESNASILRQENKGMSITGMVKAGSRSKSTSPPVNTQHSINVSTSRDHRPHILVFDINFNLISPRVHEQKSLLIDGQWNDHIRVPISFSEPNSANSSTKSAGQPDSGASRQQNSNGLPKNRFRQEVYSNKSLDIITINTPKSISDTSNVSRENPEQMRVLMKAANAITVNARIVDSRSKTLNVVPPPSIESLRGNNAYIRTKPSAGRTVVKADSKYRNRREASPNKPVDRLGTSSPTGYGKPLLTCVTKKLIVMKDTPKPMTDIKEIRPVTVRNRSPLRSWRKEQNPSVSSISGKKTDKIEPFTHPKLEMATSVLFHLIFWRLAYLAKCLVSLEWLIPSSIIAVGILFWTAKTGTAGNLLRTVNTVGRNKPDEKLTVQRGAPPAKQIRGSSTSVRNRSPCRTGKPENKQDPLRAKPIKPPLQNDPKSWTSDFNNSPTRQINRNRCSAPAVNKLAQDIKGSSTSVSRNKSPCRSGKPDSKQDASNSKSPTRQPNRNRCSATAIAKTVQDTNKNERKNPSSPTFSKPSPTGTRVVNTEHKIERPIPDHMKVILNNPYNKDLSMSMISGIYNKSFKPQLEDIKSSFMLLNKKQEQIRQNEKGKEESITDLKSSGFDEETRREQLAEIKKKFKSKHFWNDSKYDKIEGLNWISWK